jgi:hypothetical protein
MEEALAQRVRPLQLEGMEVDALKERVQEYWKAYSGLKKEKVELQIRQSGKTRRYIKVTFLCRFQEQDNEIKEAQEKLAEVYLEKQAKKGVDMERLALGPGGGEGREPIRCSALQCRELLSLPSITKGCTGKGIP